MEKGAKSADLLLIYGNTRLKPEFHKEIWPLFPKKPKKVGISESGEIVLNTEIAIPRIINNHFSLEKDFSPSRTHINKLAEALGVSI